MIQLCPFCGHSVDPVYDGITSCRRCSRVFDTCPINRLLSASWLTRRKNITTVDQLRECGYSAKEADLVISYVVDQCYSHEEFFKELKDLGISARYELVSD